MPQVRSPFCLQRGRQAPWLGASGEKKKEEKKKKKKRKINKGVATKNRGKTPKNLGKSFNIHFPILNEWRPPPHTTHTERERERERGPRLLRGERENDQKGLSHGIEIHIQKYCFAPPPQIHPESAVCVAGEPWKGSTIKPTIRKKNKEKKKKKKKKKKETMMIFCCSDKTMWSMNFFFFLSFFSFFPSSSQKGEGLGDPGREKGRDP